MDSFLIGVGLGADTARGRRSGARVEPPQRSEEERPFEADDGLEQDPYPPDGELGVLLAVSLGFRR